MPAVCLRNIIIYTNIISEVKNSVYEMIMAILSIISVLVMLFLYEMITTNAQECDTLPSDNTIEDNLQTLLFSEGGENPDINPNLLTVMYTCMAQGMTMGSYREVSVIVTYDNVANSPQSRQFELECLSSQGGSTGWQGYSLNLAPTGFETLETRTDCSLCRESANNDPHDCVGKGLSNILLLHIMLIICSLYHTVACHPDCNYGLMRCNGTGNDSCCPLFDNGVCTTSCSQNNHVAIEQNNYTCCKSYLYHCSSIYQINKSIYLSICLSIY